MKKSPPKRAYKKRAYRGRRRMPYSKTGGKVTALRTATVPDRLVLKMKYTDNFVLSGLGGATRVFRMNSIYDPDTSLVNGHQPLGYDQWDIFYNKYRVFRARVTLKATNASSNQADTEQIGMAAIANSTYLSSDDSFFEQPHCKKATLAGRGGIDTKVLTYDVDIPRILGQASVVYRSNQNAAALFGANPIETCNLAIFTRPIDGQSTALVNCEISITYFCELFDRSPVGISYPAGKDPDAPGATDGTIAELVGA